MHNPTRGVPIGDLLAEPEAYAAAVDQAATDLRGREESQILQDLAAGGSRCLLGRDAKEHERICERHSQGKTQTCCKKAAEQLTSEFQQVDRFLAADVSSVDT